MWSKERVFNVLLVHEQKVLRLQIGENLFSDNKLMLMNNLPTILTDMVSFNYSVFAWSDTEPCPHKVRLRTWAVNLHWYYWVSPCV